MPTNEAEPAKQQSGLITNESEFEGSNLIIPTSENTTFGVNFMPNGGAYSINPTLPPRCMARDFLVDGKVTRSRAPEFKQRAPKRTRLLYNA